MGAPRVLVVGGGYVGLYTALKLQRKLRRGEAEIVLVEPRPYMTYQPFLPEAAAGSLEPRHVVVPLRPVLRKERVDVVTGEVTSVEHARKTARVVPRVGPAYDLQYDHIVLAPGSVARTLPIPGLAEHGIGFKRVEEAIFLRNHVIDQLDIAESSDDPKVRRSALTFVFVGGGYAGVEAFAELEDMARYAMRYYRDIAPRDMRWVLVEASHRILPEVDEDMGRYTLEQLRARGMDVRLNTRLVSAVDQHIVLDDGAEMDANTLVWTAGVKAHPLLAHTDLPLDEKGRLKATPELTVEGVEGAWTAGDCAAVPDLTQQPGALTSPSAQHAVRQARRLARNVVAALRGEPLQPYRYAHVGSVASLGLHKGVAQVYGVKLRGWPAWFLHRTYHLSRVPTLNRKAHTLSDWTLALFFPREVVSLGSLSQPRAEFSAFAARPRSGDGAAAVPVPADGRDRTGGGGAG